MTGTELELFVETLKWRVRYVDSNPDVGWGPSLETLISDISQAVGMNLTEQEFEVIVNLYQMKGYRPPR